MVFNLTEEQIRGYDVWLGGGSGLFHGLSTMDFHKWKIEWNVKLNETWNVVLCWMKREMCYVEWNMKGNSVLRVQIEGWVGRILPSPWSWCSGSDVWSSRTRAVTSKTRAVTSKDPCTLHMLNIPQHFKITKSRLNMLLPSENCKFEKATLTCKHILMSSFMHMHTQNRICAGAREFVCCIRNSPPGN